MKVATKYTLLTFIFFIFAFAVQAQEEDEEDWSIYDDYELDDDLEVKRYAAPTLSGMSPQRFISISYDAQLPYNYNFSAPRFPASDGGGYATDETPEYTETGRSRFTGGMRFNTNIPIISKSSFVWQSGINYMQTVYSINPDQPFENSRISLPNGEEGRGLGQILHEDGLNNLNWTNTFFFPINERDFIVFQGQADLSGNYSLTEFQTLSTLRYSAAAVYGRRMNDYFRWGVGISRTYRVGNLNYVPVIMYDWTSKNRKWGTEILFPARAYVRYNFSKDMLLLTGFDLEGQSYRISDYSVDGNSFELRRGELRPKLEFQAKITGYIWLSLQGGYRWDYSFDADELADGSEIFRGFFGSQEFAMRNQLQNTFFFNVGLNFVSP